jgi:hypothetical protein
MKRLFLVVIFLTFVLAVAAAQQAQPAAELTFTFTRLSGSASNQFAVWIENSQGQYIRTLYATRYTANGGWKVRETSIPVWVKQSGLSTIPDSQIDAVSGATPRTGTLTYTWDGTNNSGAPVPAGNYVIILEGTLRWGNQVYYRAPIALGQGTATPQVSIQYVDDPTRQPVLDDRKMIDNVRVRTLR